VFSALPSLLPDLIAKARNSENTKEEAEKSSTKAIYVGSLADALHLFELSPFRNFVIPSEKCAVGPFS